jgi:hypothetical protein
MIFYVSNDFNNMGMKRGKQVLPIYTELLGPSAQFEIKLKEL